MHKLDADSKLSVCNCDSWKKSDLHIPSSIDFVPWPVRTGLVHEVLIELWYGKLVLGEVLSKGELLLHEVILRGYYEVTLYHCKIGA